MVEHMRPLATETVARELQRRRIIGALAHDMVTTTNEYQIAGAGAGDTWQLRGNRVGQQAEDKTVCLIEWAEFRSFFVAEHDGVH